MKRHALLELRTAVAGDFTNSYGNKKIGAVYLVQSSTGIIETKIHYLTELTNMVEFKELYNCGQIYVFASPSEAKSTFNCIDWDLIDRELDYELEQFTKLKKTA